VRPLLIVLAVVLGPVGIALALAVVVRRYVADQPDPWIEKRITRPRYRWEKADEALQQRTAARREAAHRIRTRAAHVESGSPVSELLRRVK